MKEKRLFYFTAVLIFLGVMSCKCIDGKFVFTDNSNTLEECKTEVNEEVEKYDQIYKNNNPLTISKSADKTSFTSVGEIINYTYEINNLSGIDWIDLKDLLVEDSLVDVTCQESTVSSSAPVICTGSYTITMDDLANGKVENIATATTNIEIPLSCRYSTGNSYEYLDKYLEYTNTASTSLTILVDANPSLSLNVAANPTSYSGYQVVSYTYTLTNSGNVPLTPGFSINDDLVKDNWSCGERAELNPGESMECSGSYAIDAGIRWTITNNATACAYYNDQLVCSNSASASVSYRQPPTVESSESKKTGPD